MTDMYEEPGFRFSRVEDTPERRNEKDRRLISPKKAPVPPQGLINHPKSANTWRSAPAFIPQTSFSPAKGQTDEWQ